MQLPQELRFLGKVVNAMDGAPDAAQDWQIMRSEIVEAIGFVVEAVAMPLRPHWLGRVQIDAQR